MTGSAKGSLSPTGVTLGEGWQQNEIVRGDLFNRQSGFLPSREATHNYISVETLFP
jgi:hypothetical protein